MAKERPLKTLRMNVGSHGQRQASGNPEDDNIRFEADWNETQDISEFYTNTHTDCTQDHLPGLTGWDLLIWLDSHQAWKKGWGERGRFTSLQLPQGHLHQMI